MYSRIALYGYTVSILIKDPDAEAAIRQFAAETGQTLTAAVKDACRAALERKREARPLIDRLAPLLARVAAVPDTGLRADKAFLDELYGEPGYDD